MVDNDKLEKDFNGKTDQELQDIFIHLNDYIPEVKPVVLAELRRRGISTKNLEQQVVPPKGETRPESYKNHIIAVIIITILAMICFVFNTFYSINTNWHLFYSTIYNLPMALIIWAFLCMCSWKFKAINKGVSFWIILVALTLGDLTAVVLKGNDPPNNKTPVITNQINVFMTRESTNGITEKHLKDPNAIKTLESLLVKQWLDESEKAFYSQGGKGKFKISADLIDSKSWSITVDGKNFAIIRMSFRKKIQMTSIIGIKNDVFIKITGVREGENPVPITYGPFSDKVKDVFGVKLLKPTQ